MRIGGILALVIALAATAEAQDGAGRQQLAPTGKLRVGLNMGNALTTAVGKDLARELARRLDVEPVFVDYPTPGAVTEGVGTQWDIAFVAADPDRTAAITFTPPYVELDVTYLVRADSTIRTVADVDRAGIRIATGTTSAYTLFLKREARHAALILLNGDAATMALRSGTVDAQAGLRFNLLQAASQIPGARVLPDNFTQAQQAIALPRANTAGLSYVTAFLAEMLRSGFVTAAIQKTGLTGASVPGF